MSAVASDVAAPTLPVFGVDSPEQAQAQSQEQSQARPLRRVALCVDDFGMHSGVNEAVLRLADIARLTAVGCLVDGPAFATGAALVGGGWRTLHGVAVGLHLDLTEGYTSVAKSLRSLIVSAYLRRLPEAALRHEIERQLDAFERAIGGAPDFVDGHQHVHQLPQVRDALVDILKRRYGARLPWLRSTRRPAQLTTARFKAGVIERLGSGALARLARADGFAQNGHLLGVYGFDEAAGRYEELTRRWLEASVDGDLLMCHPSAHTTTPDTLLPARLREYQWLTSLGFGRQLADTGVTLGLRESMQA